MVWSQSSLKDLENQATCPVRWKHEWIDGGQRAPSTPPQMYGLYFERLVLGASAHDDKLELPTLKTGKPPIAQMRLEEQAAAVKEELNKPNNIFGFQPSAVQIKLTGTIHGVEVAGVLDAIDDSGEIPIIGDLKCTADLTNDFSEYGWGNNGEGMDLLQQIVYEELYRQNFEIQPKSKLIIADYSPETRTKVINLKISEETQAINLERFKFGNEVVETYQDSGWPYLPSIKECEKCQIKDCPFRMEGGRVETIDLLI